MTTDQVGRRLLIALAAGILISPLTAVQAAEEPVDEGVIAKIKMEAFQHSEVMDTLSWLSDVNGPRLSGSPELRDAAEWARTRLTHWGLVNSTLEPDGWKGRGWTLKGFSVEMTAPRYMRITGHPLAWSPPTAAAVVGAPILVDVKSKEDFDKYRGKLHGAIVMNGHLRFAGGDTRAQSVRFSAEELAKREQLIDPVTPGMSPDTTASYKDQQRRWHEELAQMNEVYRFFADEGIAALVLPSEKIAGVRTDGFYDDFWHPTYPGFVISREHYGRIQRMLERQQPVELSVSLAARFIDNAEGFNVVAEIAGVDPTLKSQVVMLGGHLDSWHAGTGAVDNGAGCAVALEAVRILKAIGVRPRRTIRIALWTGEEQDYAGSVGYVQKHFGNVQTGVLKPDHARLSAYFNLDDGSGRIRGVHLQGNEAVRPIFQAWLRPFNYLGATTLTTLSVGETDHIAFDAIGLPGFEFLQDPLDYGTTAHHTDRDVYERAVPEDLEQAAAVMASFVYHAAMRAEMLPRKPSR